MSSRLGLITDVHANMAPVKQAMSIFQQAKVDRILCAGDIAGYGVELEQTIQLLIDNDCWSIMGNHDLWYLQEDEQNETTMAGRYLKQLPVAMDLHIESCHLHMVHANPPDSYRGGIKLLDENGCLLEEARQHWDEALQEFNYDVLIVGHTHQVFAERMGQMLVINPGSSIFNHACAILNLPELSVEFIPLSNRRIEASWNWSRIRVKSPSDSADFDPSLD